MVKFCIQLAFTLLVFTVYAQPSDFALDGCKNHALHLTKNLNKRSSENTKYYYNVDFVECNFTIFPRASGDITGKVSTHVSFTKNSDTVWFDLLSTLTVDSIKANGFLRNFTHKNDRISIKLNAFNIGEKGVITIFYHGNPLNAGGFGYYAKDKHLTDDALHTLSQPYGAKYWWPCKQTLNDKIDSIYIHITTHNDMVGVSNGLLTKIDSLNPLTKTFTWKHRYPIATYLVAVAISNYTNYKHKVKLPSKPDSLVIENYVFPQFKARFIKESFETVGLMQLFDSLFGSYPFAKEHYGHAQIMWGGGMEHQTMSFMGSMDPDLIAHELAHQWFGDATTCGTWQDLWLNESFATWATSLRHGFVNDSVNYHNYRWWMRKAGTKRMDGSVFAFDTSNVSNLFTNALRYSKGAFVIHMLRKKMGDVSFFNGLRQHLMQNKYGFEKTEGFKNTMESYCKCNLDTFFAEWIYGQGFPMFNIKWKQIGKQVKVDIIQTTSSLFTTFFHAPVSITFKQKGQKEIKTFYPNSNNTSFTFETKLQIDTAIFDEDIHVLSFDSTTGNNENKGTTRIKIFPNPTNNILEIIGSVNEAFIYNQLGQLVISKKFNLNMTKEIDVKNLTKGIYYLKFFDNKETICKFVKL